MNKAQHAQTGATESTHARKLQLDLDMIMQDLYLNT